MQLSFEAVPPPSQWTVAWRARLKDLDVNSHLAFTNSFVISAKALKLEIYQLRMIHGDSSEAEERMQAVGCLSCNPYVKAIPCDSHIYQIAFNN
jgi:hypothetical protein